MKEQIEQLIDKYKHQILAHDLALSQIKGTTFSDISIRAILISKGCLYSSIVDDLEKIAQDPIEIYKNMKQEK